ncbi:hypothetical protein [Bacillus haynesii]|uniref:hypothetical protein n=1 Tax=Bacillus haynesii TaxID=1925021 RepID=UPI001F61C8DE|nr:hypothetical protein [Bacillus haynesii]MCI4127090.1 hypothetical protein [Bacillus haynesii]
MEHDWGAFMNRNLVVEPLSAEGSLKNLSFTVKDVFAVEGHTNAAGNPSADHRSVTGKKRRAFGAFIHRRP